MPETVSAVGRDAIVRGIPDVVFINLVFPSGVLANVELSWLAPSKLRRTAVVGSKKMVVYDDVSVEQIKVYDHGVVYEDPETFGQYQPRSCIKRRAPAWLGRGNVRLSRESTGC
jgi:predicted dehydrogenase